MNQKIFVETINAIVLFVLAVIVSVILIPVGIIWNIVKSIKATFQYKFWKGVFHFVKYWFNVSIQMFFVVGYVFYHVAIALDLFWNVLAGEFVEDCITDEENTAFGIGAVTISAAIGRQEKNKKLNKVGKKFSKFLNVVFQEEAHCVDHWENIKEEIEPFINE